MCAYQAQFVISLWFMIDTQFKAILCKKCKDFAFCAQFVLLILTCESTSVEQIWLKTCKIHQIRKIAIDTQLGKNIHVKHSHVFVTVCHEKFGASAFFMVQNWFIFERDNRNSKRKTNSNLQEIEFCEVKKRIQWNSQRNFVRFDLWPICVNVIGFEFCANEGALFNNFKHPKFFFFTDFGRFFKVNSKHELSLLGKIMIFRLMCWHFIVASPKWNRNSDISSRV